MQLVCSACKLYRVCTVCAAGCRLPMPLRFRARGHDNRDTV